MTKIWKRISAGENIDMRLLIISVGLFLFQSCSEKKPVIDQEAYKLEIDNWHLKRVADLKAENGWLNLAGLFWLKEGINSFGSDQKNDLVFPEGKISRRAGFFVRKNGIVSMQVLPDVNIMADGKPVKDVIIFHPDSTSNPKLEHGSLRWSVIKRNDLIGVRLRDLESKTAQEFQGVEYYAVNSDWRVDALMEQSDTAKRISITNVLGQTFEQTSPGMLVFSINEKEYRLDALEEGEELFIIFGDSTNANETYPSGRYVYANKPDSTGRTILDFNKAYNPPCAFTAFATCPLPPKQNVLSLSVRAGEKKYNDGHH